MTSRISKVGKSIALSIGIVLAAVGMAALTHWLEGFLLGKVMMVVFGVLFVAYIIYTIVWEDES